MSSMQHGATSTSVTAPTGTPVYVGVAMYYRNYSF